MASSRTDAEASDTASAAIDEYGSPAPRTRRELREARSGGTLATDIDAAPAPDDAATQHVGPESTGTARRTRGALAAIGNGVLIALLVAVIGVAGLTIVVPAATGATALTVLTSSMEPALPPGTLIVIRPTDEITAGDVITYQLVSGEPEVVTHRVVQSLVLTDGEPVYVTKGDANPTPDPVQVRAVQVRGELWYAVPFIGWASAAVTGEARAIIIPVVVGALFAYAAWMTVSWLRDRRRSRRPA